MSSDDDEGEVQGDDLIVAQRAAAARPGQAVRMNDVIEHILCQTEPGATDVTTSADAYRASRYVFLNEETDHDLYLLTLGYLNISDLIDMTIDLQDPAGRTGRRHLRRRAESSIRRTRRSPSDQCGRRLSADCDWTPESRTRTSRALRRKDERRRAGAPTRLSRLKPASTVTLVRMRVTGIMTWTISLFLMMLNFNHSLYVITLQSLTLCI